MALLNRSTVVLMQTARGAAPPRRAAAPWPLAPPPALLALLARPVLPLLPLLLARPPPPAAVGGADALRVPRGDPRTAHIPLIAPTANAMPRDVERGLALGFADYLSKPINLDEFGAAVDRALAAAAGRTGAAREARP